MVFYKNNLINKKYEISSKELMESFIKSSYYKDYDNGSRNLHVSILLYIMEGLNSTFHMNERSNEFEFTQTKKLIRDFPNSINEIANKVVEDVVENSEEDLSERDIHTTLKCNCCGVDFDAIIPKYYIEGGCTYILDTCPKCKSLENHKILKVGDYVNE